MSESGQSWQQQLPGRPEFGETARRWVASHLDHPYSGLLTAELWAAAITNSPDLVLLTLSTSGCRVRITAYTPAPVTADAVTDIGRRILAALTSRYGISPDGCGFFAEITR